MSKCIHPDCDNETRLCSVYCCKECQHHHEGTIENWEYILSRHIIEYEKSIKEMLPRGIPPHKHFKGDKEAINGYYKFVAIKDELEVVKTLIKESNKLGTTI